MANASPWKVKASKGGGNGDVKDPAPEGVHQARLVAMVDLGHHHETYQGGKPKDVRKLYFAWELLGCPMPGSKFNYVVAQDYSLTFGELSNLRKVVKGMRGKDVLEGEDYDLDKLLGKPCQIQVEHKRSQQDRPYAKIANVMPVPQKEARSVPPAGRKPLLWAVGDDLEVLEVNDWLPYRYGEPVLDVVKRCHELGGRRTADGPATAAAGGETGPGQGGPEEEIPW